MISLILISIATFTWVHLTGIPARIKWAYKLKSIKPIDCELCLAFWIQGIYSYNAGCGLFWSVIYGLFAGFIANMIYLILRVWKII